VAFDELEAKLSAWGIRGGLHALVLRWREHALALERASLRWEHQFDPGFPERQQASHGLGIFTLDATNLEGEWLLRHEWRGWGWREYGYGDARELKSKALEMVRSGGPFGGPEHIFRRASHTAKSPTSEMLRYATTGGELRIGNLAPGLGVVLHVRPDGTFASRTLDPDDRQAEPAKLAAALGPAESSVSGQRRVPWIFADVWPLLGVIRTSTFDLLSCWLAPDAVAVIAAKNWPHGVRVGTWSEIRDLDVERWLTTLPKMPLIRAASATSASVSPPSWPTDASREPPSPPSRPAAASPPRSPAPPASPPNYPASATSPPRSPAPPASPPNYSASATSPPRSPVPPASPPSRPASATSSPRSPAIHTHVEPPSPASPPAIAARVEPVQAMKLPPGLADALAACFAVVEGELPARQTGAEFARELVWVLVRAACAGATTMTGTPAELLLTLHRLGYLRSVPSDQVGRDAFKMLAARTSLVRRIHHRRWRLAFGDLLNPESLLREELRRYEPT
jgi:hypothetical protein